MFSLSINLNALLFEIADRILLSVQNTFTLWGSEKYLHMH